MYKNVNGVKVDIKNIELFKRAAYGTACCASAFCQASVSVTKDELDRLYKYRDMYMAAYRKLPYPLHAVEDMIKYAVLGITIKKEIYTESREKIKMWADDGLCVLLTDGSAGTGAKIARFIGKTYAVEIVKHTKQDNADIDKYLWDDSYDEFEWCLNRMIKKELVAGYYQAFLPGFTEACKGEYAVLRHELKDVLNLREVPEMTKPKAGRIVHAYGGNSEEYIVDVFEAGQDENSEMLYDFNIYRKVNGGTLAKADDAPEGLAAVYQEIAAKAETAGGIGKVGYSGIIEGGYIIFSVEGFVYCSKLLKHEMPVEIAQAALIGVENGRVYLKTEQYIPGNRYRRGVTEHTVYSYSIEEGTTCTCRIEYTEGR